jgi:hypothetical protein
MRKIIFIGLALLLCTGMAHGQDKKSVAVVPATGESVSRDIRIGISNGLQEGVFNSGIYKLVARGAAFEKALGELKFQQSGAVDDSQLTDFGHAVRADFVCYATVSKYSEMEYRISYKMIDVATSEIVHMDKETVRTGASGLLDATDNIAAKLFGKKGANERAINNNPVVNDRPISGPKPLFSDYLPWRDKLKQAISTNPRHSWDSGSRYKGQDRNNGAGAYLWNDGDIYFGGFKENHRDGYGIYIVPDKGYSVRNCPDCIYYVGFWSNGDKSGSGTCYDKEGNVIYYGEFENDKPTGTYPHPSLSEWKFKIKEYDMNGKAYYIGETTSKGERRGFGTLIWQDGDMWYGHWTDDSRDGYGIYIYNSGNVLTGTWKGDTHTP